MRIVVLWIRTNGRSLGGVSVEVGPGSRVKTNGKMNILNEENLIFCH